ncbi:ANTAR domain-containing protein [Rhodococcus sp. T2V]|uniref:ANTAR domain-containing protein n=1 Tax=Rhodococcus sp. T2V TaxID=3034164 RepID=UPI0023E2CA90|nr:ANTAR domain-containing protein [Rhodococcus sp. T2V]MDF3312019.1 ANTAR domain-containing protein [Rhodococcus sp. T2V]
MTAVPEPGREARHSAVGVQRARDGRETLSLAEGILIALRRCGRADAFDELLRVAQRHHLSVLTVAHVLVDFAIGARPPLGSPERHASTSSALAEWETRLDQWSGSSR